MQTPSIELQNALYRYPRGGFSVCCPDLKLYPGELTLITGPNGCGKTTLSKMLCGILPLTEGTLLLNGKSAAGKSLGFIGKTVGYLFQSPEKQLFATSVIEEVTFVPLLKGENETSVIARAEDLLATFGMTHLRERSPYRLSRGEKQRLALCAILMQGTTHLILDEPTTGLDRENRAILHNMLSKLLQRGVGLSIITHDNELRRKFQARPVTVVEGVVQA